MEKNFTIRWNLVAIAGGGAFFLSFLLGIVSGSGFLTFFFRALLFGGVFAILSGGISFILERFIPELFISFTGEPGQKREKDNVNIVLEGGNPMREDGIEELVFEDETNDASSQAEDEGMPLEEEQRIAYAERREIGEDGYSDDTEGLEEAESEPGDDLTAGEEEVAQRRQMPAAEREDAEDGVEPETTAPLKPQKTDNLSDADVDVLPDMSAFESSFSPISGPGVVNDNEPFGNLARSSLKTGQAGKDPEIYAKAVRTLIKRDEGKKR